VKKYAKDPKMTVGSLDRQVLGLQGKLPKGKGVEYRLDEISYQQARNEMVRATTDLLRKEGVLGGGSGVGARKAAVSAPNTPAAPVNKNANAQNLMSQYGAKNVLADPKEPDAVKGNVVQPAVRPNSAVDGEYTVSFDPKEMGTAAGNFEGDLVDLNKRIAIKVGGAPAPGPANPPAGTGTVGQNNGNQAAGSHNNGTSSDSSTNGARNLANQPGSNQDIYAPSIPGAGDTPQTSFQQEPSGMAPATDGNGN
jgi:hypothetical protein